jgi:hypothetical protein
MGLELKLVSFLGVREKRGAREIPAKPGGLSFEPAARELQQGLFLSLRIDDLVRSAKTMVSIVGARRVAPDIGHAQRAPTMQGAQKLRSEAHLQVCRNDSPR